MIMMIWKGCSLQGREVFAVYAIFVQLVILQIVNFDVDDREGELFAGQGSSVNSGEGFAGTLGHLDSLRLSRGARRSE